MVAPLLAAVCRRRRGPTQPPLLQLQCNVVVGICGAFIVGLEGLRALARRKAGLPMGERTRRHDLKRPCVCVRARALVDLTFVLVPEFDRLLLWQS